MTWASRAVSVASVITSQVPPSAAGVRYLCLAHEHIRLGLSIPDRSGHLTIYHGEWSYCPATRPDETHTWEAIPSTPLSALRHATLLKLVPSAQERRSRAHDRARTG